MRLFSFAEAVVVISANFGVADFVGGGDDFFDRVG